MTFRRVSSLFLLLLFSASSCLAQAAKKKPQPASPPAQDDSGSADDSPADSGTENTSFAIEAEMLTYASLESNSEAIACDISKYLFPSSVALSPNGPNQATKSKKTVTLEPLSTPCAAVPTGQPSGLIILSSSGNTLANFQAWRVDMATMRQLKARASTYCAAAENNRPVTLGAPVISPTSVGGDVESVLKLFATNETAAGLTGTVHDEALTDGIARQLRALGVPVLLPDSYSPYSLGGADFSQFPLLKSLLDLVETRSCVRAALDKETDPAKQVEPKSLLDTIDAFITGLTTPPSGSTAPPVAVALAADGFAQAIGVNPDGTFSPDSIWKHVLVVKALESGGSRVSHGNIFGSKVEYSGGSVATYTLYTPDGRLSCSGNVFAYGGYAGPDEIASLMARPDIDPRHQLIFLRGGCAGN